MTRKDVSIVVPIFNVETYLRKCLDSLYAQADDTMEVILVNDGSTDRSPIICEEYCGQHPGTLYINKVNGGLSDARNAGVRAATGRYIYFLDSDDWLAPHAIRTLYDFAETNRCEVVQGGFYYASDNRLEYDDSLKAPLTLNREEAMREIIRQKTVKNFAWGKLYKSDIVLDTPFREGVFFEDAFWQHLVIHKTVRYGIIPTPLYHYRQRTDSISGRFSLRNLDLLRGYEERLAFITAHYPQLTASMAKVYWEHCRGACETAAHSRSTELAGAFADYYHQADHRHAQLFSKALRHSPSYQLLHHCPRLYPAWQLVGRIWNHFFARRLKMTEV